MSVNLEQPFVSLRSRSELEREIEIAESIIANQTTVSANRTFEDGYIAAIHFIGIAAPTRHEAISIGKLHTTLNTLDEDLLKASLPIDETIGEKLQNLASRNYQTNLVSRTEPLPSKTLKEGFYTHEQLIARKKAFGEARKELEDS